jgi:hypothetical protein
MELWVVEVMIGLNSKMKSRADGGMKRWASGLGSVYGILDRCPFGAESNIIIPCHLIKCLLKPATSPQHFSEWPSLSSLNTPFSQDAFTTHSPS